MVGVIKAITGDDGGASKKAEAQQNRLIALQEQQAKTATEQQGLLDAQSAARRKSRSSKGFKGALLTGNELGVTGSNDNTATAGADRSATLG